MARLLRVPVEGLRAGLAVLDEPTSRYVVRVHRLADGDSFLAFDPVLREEGEARLVEAHPKRARYEVASTRPPTRAAAHELHLLVCAGKGDKVDEVVRDSTALGVRSITVLTSERSVADPKARAMDRWKRIAVEAARQSGRGDVPQLSGPMALEVAIAHAELPHTKLCCHPDAETPLAEALRGVAASDAVALLIGPEGGFSARELELAAAAEFRPASLGALTLRTELASIACLSMCFGVLGAHRS